eukprot:CAMPEP_0117829672 /NCGR_PEP_ID=MMETSP0949-20121206/8005_1 /TAXON_ID=44440 /ORGANISM="Chattonella subsalsa, Strain CCMP2191" /LENGTH=178 /DNA_ID=CAMNT_0005670467 /DNA_START=55 /DNA_END=591 /DNA_ORIENTATION=+
MNTTQHLESEESSNQSNIDKQSILKLNVGGTRFLTSRSTIEKIPESMLARMFSIESPYSNPTDEEGYVFIDRDGNRFNHVLNFLRSGNVPNFDDKWRYEEILEEADFFAIQELKEFVTKRIEDLQSKKQWEGTSMRPCKIIFTPDQNMPPAMLSNIAGASSNPGRIELTGHFSLDEDF